MTPQRLVRGLSAIFLCFLLCGTGGASTPLEREFRAPPSSARPWVYWFWLNGNITSNGITADLEAMKRVGIGGVLIMEVDQGAPVGPVDFGAARWRELFRHVHAEARRLGLEVNMNNDAGWNGSGGPWIKPEQSMQKLVWTETNAAGPGSFEAVLSQPETVAGYYRDLSLVAFPTPGSYRIDRIRAKAMFEVGGVGVPGRERVPDEMVIARDKVRFLEGAMDSSGRVSWDVPPGQWTIMRFGHTSTGVENAPAPKSGRGLECDKLSREGIEANFAGLMAKLAADTGIKPGQHGPGLVATHIDSWENGSQNWTGKMREEFHRRRGYDLMPFLPVVSGRVVGSLELSERFLWDLRQTVSELVIKNYAGHMRELAHAQGMRFTVEAYGGPCDSIPYAAESDEPMGEFWTPSGAIETCRAMASAGHIYGKTIVGAEAFTSGDQERWREHPALLKAHGDRAFCEGINRFVFHRYALQPWAEERRPGMMMGPWGQHYERTQTWWDWTPAWHEYLARCQFMLRQGLFVADLCYVQPEAPPQGPAGHRPGGYAWDDCTADGVMKRMSVKDGRITLPDGVSYRVLVLPDTLAMTPGLLRKVRELVQAGATVLGPMPQYSPSLSGYPDCDEEVKRVAAEVWGDCDGQRVKEHRFGKGRVVCGIAPDKFLQQSGISTDFSSDEPLRYLHRQAGGTDLYFVASSQPHEFTATCSFRVAGKIPEFWWAESGRIERAAVWRREGGLTHVAVPFTPSGSVFVVFRESVGKSDPVVSVRREGKTVLSATPAPPPRVTITKARYGIPDDPQRNRDVKETVQGKVDGGEYSFPVSQLAQGGDPAQGEAKTLVVDYVVDGKTFSVRARDPDIIRLGPDALSARVDKAVYGVLDDPKRTRDVREKVQRLIDAGESSFTVARMAQGDDPAFLVVKTLVLDLTIAGKKCRFTGTDPETITLVPPSAPRKPTASVSGNAGRVALETSEPGSYEVVTASGKTFKTTVPAAGAPLELAGPWLVSFSAGSGAPSQTTLDKLASFTENSDPGVKYFSGVATYTKTFAVPRQMMGKGERLYLDLGKVQVMAQVRLNGKNLGTLWKPPFRVDITGLAKPAGNQLEVRVVNLLVNRMIGDEQLPEDSQRNPDGTLKQWPQWLLEGKPSPSGRLTFASWRLWKKTDAPLESGLIGPVQLQNPEVVTLKY